MRRLRASAGSGTASPRQFAGQPSGGPATTLAVRTWTELDALPERPVLAVPLGATEQHGPHLPLDTDTRIAVALVDALAARCRVVLAGPAITVGASDEHAAFPGTLSVGTRPLADGLVALAASARRWARAVLVVNAHGGNADALMAAVERCDEQTAFWSMPTLGDVHAGRVETSIMLAIAPHTVRGDYAGAGPSDPLGVLLDDLRRVGVRPLSPNGVLGDPTHASATEGRVLLAHALTDLIRAAAPLLCAARAA